jgi:hypothetical protein
MGLLCLLQVACKPNGAVDDPESNLIDLDKFGVTLNDATRKRNLVIVSIEPGSSGMMLEDFFITASLEDNKGVVSGNMGEKKGSNLIYDVALQDRCLEVLFLQSPSSCLGKNDTRFGQGKKVSFRLEAMPGAAVKTGDKYTLTVKVERKGSHPHIETKSTILTAKKDGVATKEQTGEASTSDTSPQNPDAAAGTVSGSATPPISPPTPSTDLPVPVGEASTSDTSPPMLISNAGLPATPNSAPPNTNSGQVTDPSDSTTDDHAHSTDTNRPIATSDEFTVTLKNKTQSGGARNFVLVTIQPGDNGMALGNFSVTATLADGEGTVMGSSSRNGNGFLYNSTLDNCTLASLFLVGNVKCLGADDTSFKQSSSVSFKIEVKPGAALKQGDPYTLTVQIAYTGSNPHTKTDEILLKATKKSPVKGKKAR